jgi:hypothetical protein
MSAIRSAILLAIFLCAAGISAMAASAPAMEASPPRFALPANALDCGAPSQEMVGYDLIGVHEYGLPPPDLPADVRTFTFTLAQWECMYPPAPVETPGFVVDPSGDAEDPFGGAHAEHPPHRCESACSQYHPAGAPKTGSAGGYLKVMIVLPNQGDPQYPADTCNWHDVGDAMIALTNQVGPGATYERWCYHNVGFTSRGSQDAYALIDYLHKDVSLYHPWMVDASNEIVIGWVKVMSHNGIGYQGERFSLIAEDRATCCSWWEDSVTLHEVGHNFKANHYPNEADKNNCFYSSSVMNYCGLPNHSLSFDSGNKNTVKTQYWSS